MSTATKKIIAAVVTAAVCLAVILVALALTVWRSDDTPHIKIEDDDKPVQGQLSIVLKRERLETVTLDVNGLATLKDDKTVTDFTNSKNNVFGISDDVLVGPNCYFAASMVISNSKPYDFEYFLEIVPVNGDKLLAEQLKLTVTIDNEVVLERTLSGGLTTKVFPIVSSGTSARFTVRMEYLDVPDNDKTKNTTLTFDMTVHARLAQNKEN